MYLTVTITTAMNLGWHMGTVQVGKVQPGPVPMKPIPVWVQVQTCTAHPQVSSNTVGTHKPIWVCHYFPILA